MRIDSLITCLFLCVWGCSAPATKTHTPATDNDSVLPVVNTDTPPATADPNISSPGIYVNELMPFYGSDEHYISLFFRDTYTESIANLLNHTDTVMIMQDGDEHRIQIDEGMVNRYLLVEGLDSLLVFNSDQQLVDTLTRLRYEHYSSGPEDLYVASYEKPVHKNSGLVMSLAQTRGVQFKPSPGVRGDSAYVKGLLKALSFQVDNLYGCGYMMQGQDTLCWITFADYGQQKECAYLIKNGLPTDSLINDFAITHMTPVPLATAGEWVYLAESQIPETDIYWTGLVGIDALNGKMTFYDRSRLLRE